LGGGQKAQGKLVFSVKAEKSAKGEISVFLPRKKFSPAGGPEKTRNGPYCQGLPRKNAVLGISIKKNLGFSTLSWFEGSGRGKMRRLMVKNTDFRLLSNLKTPFSGYSVT
jgi:hypothetical protein